MIHDKIRNFFIVSVQLLLLGLIAAFPFIHRQITPDYWQIHRQTLTGQLMLLVMAIGLFLIVSAFLTMRRSFTITIQPPAQGQLRTSGPFRYTRNPIYVGLFLLSFAWAAFWNLYEVATLSVFLFLLLWIKVMFEEQALLKKFGKTYTEYCEKTPRFFYKSF